MHQTESGIYLLDIETAPNLGYTWGKWEQNVIEFVEDWYILSFAYKQLGVPGVTVKGLNDYPGFMKDKKNDSKLVQELWQVFDKADIIIAHNGDNFDVKKSNTRFLQHKLSPPSPYRTVDTRKMARKIFRFDSNKLDDLGHYLGVGRKMHHIGFPLWLACMDGDTAAWNMMKRYNKQDILLLERIYLRMRSWMSGHPHVHGVGLGTCPKCGSNHVQSRGWSRTNLRYKQRFQCQTCGGWYEGPAQKERGETDGNV